MSFLILGDVHLGKSLHLGKVTPGSNLNSRLNDQLKLLDFTLETAIDHRNSYYNSNSAISLKILNQVQKLLLISFLGLNIVNLIKLMFIL